MHRSLLLAVVLTALAVAQPKPVTFEVASVKPSDPRADGAGAKGDGGGLPFHVEHDRFVATNRNLYGLIIQAYGVRSCRPLGEVDCVLVIGGPDWIKKARFEIQAKMPAGSLSYTTTQFLNGQAPQLQAMLQALLAERFHLKVHRESRILPAYTLSVAKNGHKLTKASESEPALLAFRPSEQPNGVKVVKLDARNQSIQEVADMYSRVLGRPVFDLTGLEGKFDFAVEYDADTDRPGAFTELAGPAMFRAFQEQAGLKFEATKRPVEILVIDAAQRPSAN